MQRMHADSQRPSMRRVLLTVGLAAALLLTGCSGAQQPTGQGAPTDTTGPARETVAAGTGCGEESNQHCPAELMPPDYNRDQIIEDMIATPAKSGSIDSIMDENRANPSKWAGPTTPVALPSGTLTMAGISCNSALAGCVAPLEAIGEVAKELGWEFNLYDGAGNGETISKYILSAVTAQVDAIFVAGLDPLTIQQGLEAADKAGIPVISITSALNSPNPVVEAPPGAFWPVVDVSSDFVRSGRMMADWAIQDSAGKGSIIVLDGKESTTQISSAAAIDEINKLCAGCTTYSYTLLGAEVGTSFPQKTLSFLRSHPDAKYIILPYDPAASALVPVLQQAGLQDVKLISVLGLAENLQFIRDGQNQVVDVAWDNAYSGWAALDQLFRHLADQDFVDPANEGLPQLLLDKSNVGTGSGNWATDIDYKSQYRKLWGIG